MRPASSTVQKEQDTFDATTEAGGVAQLPVAGRPFGGVGRQAADEEGHAEAQVFVLTLVDR